MGSMLPYIAYMDPMGCWVNSCFCQSQTMSVLFDPHRLHHRLEHAWNWARLRFLSFLKRLHQRPRSPNGLRLYLLQLQLESPGLYFAEKIRASPEFIDSRETWIYPIGQLGCQGLVYTQQNGHILRKMASCSRFWVIPVSDKHRSGHIKIW